jgi:AGCS family alanine or glycine:cation symporter
VSGLITSALVAAVILGGIHRIGKVTSILAPAMAALYVFGALVILVFNAGAVIPALTLIFREAFNPTAGVAGTGVGAFLMTMMWGVRRGLFSNEAGQGSAPIAHAAAKTDEPVSEGVVALLEPFIDTIVICSMTGLVILTTGVWNDRVPTEITFGGGDLVWVAVDADGSHTSVDAPGEIRLVNGLHLADGPGAARVGWHDVVVDQLFIDAARTQPFTGNVIPGEGHAVGDDGQTYTSLYGEAAESGAPLTMAAFERGLSGLGSWGGMIVVVCVLLFAISTAISWSYYGDRCANYLFGEKAVLPYKIAFVAMHFVGAVVPLAIVWNFGDIFLAIVIVPNLIALIMLTPKVVEETKSYFDRKAWLKHLHGAE